MKRPSELDQLIADLEAEKPRSSVAVQPDSKMVLVIEENEARYEFDGREAALLLSSRDAVERIFEALLYPEECFVELHNLEIDREVMDELEGFCSTVDEM
jgi:hypothetical protein